MFWYILVYHTARNIKKRSKFYVTCFVCMLKFSTGGRLYFSRVNLNPCG